MLVYLAAIVERADEQVLPAVYFFVGRSLGATPTQLGALTFCRAVVQVRVLEQYQCQKYEKKDILMLKGN